MYHVAICMGHICNLSDITQGLTRVLGNNNSKLNVFVKYLKMIVYSCFNVYFNDLMDILSTRWVRAGMRLK